MSDLFDNKSDTDDDDEKSCDNDNNKSVKTFSDNDLIPFPIIAESYPYFRQRCYIEKAINKITCNWLSDNEDLNTHKLKFCTFFFKKFLLPEFKEFYNLSELQITNMNINKNDETMDLFGTNEEFGTNEDNEMENFNTSMNRKYTDFYDLYPEHTIAILCTSDFIYIIFEDYQVVELKQGDIVIFYSDCRYVIFKDQYHKDHDLESEYISFKFAAKATPSQNFREWWITDKLKDTRYQFSTAKQL